MTLGSTLKKLRGSRGITQRGLATSLGMDATYLSKIESDTPNHLPGTITIEKITEALSLTRSESDALFTLADRLPPDIQSKLLSKPHLLDKVRKLR